MNWKIRNLTCILVIVLLCIALSGCSALESMQLKKDAQTYVNMKSAMNMAVEEYYAMLDRSRSEVAIDFQDESQDSDHRYFLGLLDQVESLASEIKSEEFHNAVLEYRKTAKALKYAYTYYGLFCSGLYEYQFDKSIVYDQSFQMIYADSYSNFQNYDIVFNEKFVEAQTKEDKLYNMGLFEDVEWPDDGNEYADED